jgi:hypothetical protein
MNTGSMLAEIVAGKHRPKDLDWPWSVLSVILRAPERPGGVGWARVEEAVYEFGEAVLEADDQPTLVRLCVGIRERYVLGLAGDDLRRVQAPEEEFDPPPPAMFQDLARRHPEIDWLIFASPEHKAWWRKFSSAADRLMDQYPDVGDEDWRAIFRPVLDADSVEDEDWPKPR